MNKPTIESNDDVNRPITVSCAFARKCMKNDCVRGYFTVNQRIETISANASSKPH